MGANRVRILFVNHVARISGAETGLLDIVTHLNTDRFETCAAVPPGDALAARLQQAGARTFLLPLRRFHKTVNPLSLARSAANFVTVVPRLTRLLRREEIRLVHANSDTAQIYAGPAARRAGIPCIWHSRDLTGLGFLGRWMAANASKIVAISQAVNRRLAPYVAPRAAAPDRRVVIYNGVDLERFHPQGRTEDTRQAFGAAPNDVLIGMAGQLVPWKNHPLFLAAAALVAARLPRARFVIVGEDLFGEHAGYVRHLKALADLPALSGRVVFAGYRGDMPQVLDGIDMLVHPAVDEPFGRVLVEAMAMGKPVIAADAAGPREIVRNGVDGILVAPRRPEELAHAILDVAKDRQQAARLGGAAQVRVRQAFDLRNHIQAIEAVYEELLSRPTGS